MIGTGSNREVSFYMICLLFHTLFFFFHLYRWPSASYCGVRVFYSYCTSVCVWPIPNISMFTQTITQAFEMVLASCNNIITSWMMQRWPLCMSYIQQHIAAHMCLYIPTQYTKLYSLFSGYVRRWWRWMVMMVMAYSICKYPDYTLLLEHSATFFFFLHFFLCSTN